MLVVSGVERFVNVTRELETPVGDLEQRILESENLITKIGYIVHHEKNRDH